MHMNQISLRMEHPGRSLEAGVRRVKAKDWLISEPLLLQPEAFIDQPLQARPVENIVGEFFIGEHGERGAAGIRGHFRRLFERQIGILADHRHHHAHHHLQAAQSSGLVHALIVFSAWLVGRLNFHTAPVIPWLTIFGC